MGLFLEMEGRVVSQKRGVAWRGTVVAGPWGGR